MKLWKIAKFLILLLLLFSVALVSYVFARRANPVLVRVEDRADPVGTPWIFVLNPFRDRGAENAAAAFLEQLKAGRCPQAVENLYANAPDYRRYICGHESANSLRSWSLADRVETAASVRIYFFNERSGYRGQDGQLWVTVELRGDQWQVVNYECWY